MTQNMDGELKTLSPPRMPQELASELALMRRNAGDFVVGRRVKCSLGSDRKGEKSAYEVVAEGEPAGTWCPEHGWLWFDSARYPPTERLKPSELRDRQLALARKKGPRKP